MRWWKHLLIGWFLLTAGCAGPALQPVARFPEPAPAGPLVPAPISEPPVHWTVVAGGDVVPGAWLTPYLREHGQDYPYTRIAPEFRAADIGVVNLECPLSCRGRAFKKKFTFRADPEAAEALRRAGVTAVSLANNHILDFGSEALEDTLTALDKAGIVHAGAGRNASEARRPGRLALSHGLQVALLAYSLTYPSEFWAGAATPGTALARIPVVEADVRSASAWADCVIVCFHWGGELQPLPRAYQEEYARAAVTAGARLVIGTHPHVLQGVQWLSGGLVFYSLGNLAFGGGRSRQAVDSALARVVLDAQGRVTDAWLLPLSVDNQATKFIPTPVSGPRAESVRQLVETRSASWGTRLETDPASSWLRILPPNSPVSETRP